MGTGIPYLAHLLIVTGLVLEAGGDEDEAIAALLHDAAEDAGGRATLDRIREQFGDRVASLVAALSDTLDADDRRSWRASKTAYLAHLGDITDDAVLRMALADKVHNARSIVRDYRTEGHALWERFTNKTAEDQLWYYGELLEFFSAPATVRSGGSRPRRLGTWQSLSPEIPSSPAASATEAPHATSAPTKRGVHTNTLERCLADACGGRDMTSRDRRRTLPSSSAIRPSGPVCPGALGLRGHAHRPQ